MTTIERVFDLGINFVDTADIYGQGHNERLVDSAIRGRRDKVILATKFGGDSDEQGKTVPSMGRSAYISSAIDASLKRLETDYVDLYYLHRSNDANRRNCQCNGRVGPIPGSRRAAHMEANAKAVDLELHSDELAEVARIVFNGVAGARATSDYLNRVEM